MKLTTLAVLAFGCSLLSPAQQTQDRLTNLRICEMVAAGVSMPEVLRVIATAPQIDFDLRPVSTDAMLQFGVSEDVIRAMAARELTAPVTVEKGASPPPAITSSNAGMHHYSPASQPSHSAPEPTHLPSAETVVAVPICPASNIAPPRPTGQLLSDQEVSEAIHRGLTSHRQIGLRLDEVQTLLFSGLACKACAQSGYTVTIYTPEQWIELQAQEANREMLPYSVADVFEQLRLPLLHVVALPSTPDYITGPGLSMSSSVRRVVLSDTTGRTTVQPLDLTNGSVESHSAFRSAMFTTPSGSFYMDDVSRLQARDPSSEFFVVVVGDNQNKFFKVKTRYMQQLFGRTWGDAHTAKVACIPVLGTPGSPAPQY